MSESLLEFARAKFNDLNSAEERLCRAVSEGRFLDFYAPDAEHAAPSELLPSHNGPSAVAPGSDSGASLSQVAVEARVATDEPVVRADRIAWLATEAARFVSHRGIGLKGATIEGRLDLQAANIVFAHAISSVANCPLASICWGPRSTP